jgi:ATP synthase protein I
VKKPEPEKSEQNQNSPSWESRVRNKEQRKIRARNQKSHSIWFGFGMFGIIGWSVVVPTLLGIFLGIWFDQKWSSQFSWTLTLMLAGLIIGGINAWNWIRLESQVDHQANKEEPDDDR